MGNPTKALGVDRAGKTWLVKTNEAAQAGQTFNPSYKSYGFYLEEIVCRQPDLARGTEISLRAHEALGRQ
jgi:hypothetical protein